jgi:hypothetical protein
MRVSRALPRLIYLLDRHTKESDIYLIAKAIVNCSISNEYIIKMLNKLSRSDYSMITIIEYIKNTPFINKKNLFLEILTENNDALTKYGLLCIDATIGKDLIPYLYNLSRSSNRDVRVKSIRILADMGASVLHKHIDEFIESDEWELRSVAASLVGELKLEKYIPKLKSNVNDSNLLVRYNSLKSLSKINIEGFKEVCKTASEIKNNTLQKMIFCALEDEVEKNNLKGKMQKILSSTMINSLYIKN